MNSTYTICIVEDEKPLAVALQTKLSKEGYTVIVAEDGEKALALIKEQQPDLILLDIVMPNKDGMTMLEELRDDSEWGQQAKVLIISNFNDRVEIEKAEKKNVIDYLVKSDWSLEDIVAKIKSILE